MNLSSAESAQRFLKGNMIRKQIHVILWTFCLDLDCLFYHHLYCQFEVYSVHKIYLFKKQEVPKRKV